MKVEIISINPTMCREWVEKPDRDKFTLRPSYKAAKTLYKQRIDLFTTYLLISDRQYKIGEVVEVELKPSGKSGEWSKLVAIPVQTEAGEVEAVRFGEWVKKWWVIKKGRYIHKGDFYNQDKKNYTTEQLYSLFKKAKQ